MEADERHEERFPVPVDVELVAPDGPGDIPEIAVLRDISPHGVGLVHTRPLRVGDFVTCTLLDTPVDLPCTYTIEILWQKPADDEKLFSGGRIVSEENGAPPSGSGHVG